jgi:hypothetical protein
LDYFDYFRQLYDAFNNRHVERVLGMMADDVDWPNAWKGGRLLGRDAVGDYWTAQWQELDPRVDPLAVVERADGSLEVTVHQMVRAVDGQLLADGEVLHVYRLDGDLIRRMDVEDRD